MAQLTATLMAIVASITANKTLIAAFVYSFISISFIINIINFLKVTYINVFLTFFKI